MNRNLSPEFEEILTNHKKTFIEVFWMTLASVFPVLLTWLFLYLQSEKISFENLILVVFLEGPIFAYVATLLAPFLFLLAKVLTGKKEVKVSLGGLTLFLAIFLTIVSVFLFYDKQIKAIEKKELITLNQNIVTALDKATLEAAKRKVLSGISTTKKNQLEFSSRDYLALLCYLAALILFYYSIYVNNKPTRQPGDKARENNRRLQGVLDEEFGDE